MSDDYLTLISHSFRYSPRTGKLHWKPHLRRGGRVHLRKCPTGIYQVRVGHAYLAAHDVTWAVVHGSWPMSPVRHLNGNRWDNRIENLALSSLQLPRLAPLPCHQASGH